MEQRDKRILPGPVYFVMLSGVMWALSYPPFPLGFLSFFVLVLFWYGLRGVRSLGEAAELSYLWGLVAAAINFWWVAIPTLPGMILLVLFLPVYSMLYGILHYTIARKHPDLAVLVAPVLYVGIEYLRSWGKLGFPWLNLSYSLGHYPILIQFADIFGAFGVSFWIVAINSCIYFAIRYAGSRKFWASIAAIIILFGAAFGYGVYRMRQDIEGTPLRIALLQGNIDPYEKWTASTKRKSVKMYADMIESVGGAVDLIILPETAAACYFRRSPSMFLPLVNAVKRAGVPTLMGTLDFDLANPSRYFNSAVLVIPDGTYEQTYNKIQLVPFSEYIPLQDKFKFLRKLNYGGSHFTPGDRFTIFDTNSAKFGVMICYESIFTHIARKFRSLGAEFLVNITNDGWFGKSQGPYQHAMFNVFRAIENRIWIARCANTGISMFVDPHGVITHRTRLFERAVLVGEIELTHTTTIYDRLGDFVGWGSLALSPILVWLMRK